MAVTFTYDVTLDPAIFYVRCLISDTNPDKPIFGDDEIQAMFTVAGSVYQSGPRYTTGGRVAFGSSPVSYLRVAALLCLAMASDKSRRSAITQLLDVQLSPEKAADALRTQAAEFLKMDDESGAFVFIDRIHTGSALRDRFLKSIDRGYF